MRLAAQERRRKVNEPQTTKVAHHTTYPRHEVFEVEIKDEDADAVGTSPESTEVVEFGVMPAVSRLQPANVGLDGVGGAAGGVSGGQGMEVEVTDRQNEVHLSAADAEDILRVLGDVKRAAKQYWGKRGVPVALVRLDAAVRKARAAAEENAARRVKYREKAAEKEGEFDVRRF